MRPNPKSPGDAKIVTLSRPDFCSRAQNHTEYRPGVFIRRHRRSARVNHFLRTIQELR